MNFKPLSQVRRRDVSEILALRNEDSQASISAALKLTAEAKSFGLGLRDFLDLAINVRGSEKANEYRSEKGYLSGYEATLAALTLPVVDNFVAGHVLDAASDTFQTYPGTRALFPYVVDDVVKWAYRQPQFETTSSFVAQSRTINGIEMISTVVNDEADDYQNTRVVAELGRFPVRTIRTGETAVRSYKHGGALRISYEFARRARLDMLTPYNARQAREQEMSKVAVATAILINGDGVNPAAGVVNQSTLATGTTNGVLHRGALRQWLVNRAKAGVPVDTVIGNWDAYLQWMDLFAVPTLDKTVSEGDVLARQGFQIGGFPLLQGTVNFALSSTAPANQLVGLSRADTVEELIEAGSNIEESERAITNQSITYTKSMNAGYKLVFGDTRSILNYGA